jgi:hypothetical protein
MSTSMETNNSHATTDATEILAATHQDVLPEGWTVVPLDEAAVRRSILSWLGGAVVGLGLFALLFATTRDVHGIITLPNFLLVILGFIGVGSLWLMVKYIRKYTDRARQIIVMTPEWFVQQQGDKISSIPLIDIENITLRGVFGGDASYTQVNESDPRHAVLGFGQIMGGSRARRPRRTPDSLAFVDSRTGQVITIAEDNSFTDLPVLEELLRTYVEGARARKH